MRYQEAYEMVEAGLSKSALGFPITEPLISSFFDNKVQEVGGRVVRKRSSQELSTTTTNVYTLTNEDASMRIYKVTLIGSSDSKTVPYVSEKRYAEGADEGKTMQQMFDSIPNNNPVKMELKRLKAKVDGYKRLGLYKSGSEILDRASAIVNLHNIEQADRLAMDIDDAERIAREGLGLPPVENLYYGGQEIMTPKMEQDLD